MSHLITSNYLRFDYYGKQREVYASNPNFHEVARLVRAGLLRQAVKCAAGALTPARQCKERGVRVTGNHIYFGGLRAPDTIASIYSATTRADHRRAIQLFMMKLASNPSGHDSIQQLVRFIESNRVPITSRGNFLTYKRVDGDYRDHRTHKMDNRPGQMVTMRRLEVHADPRTDCSQGLHVCSYGYLFNFHQDGFDHLRSGAPTLIVEVSPADVVSVPTDYNNSKIRCCRVLPLVRAQDLLAAYDNRPPVDLLGSLLVFDPATLRKAWAMPGALQPTRDVSVGDPLAEAWNP